MFKDNVTNTFEKLVQDNPRMRATHKLCQLALTVLNGRSARILAFQLDQIETNEQRIAIVALTTD